MAAEEDSDVLFEGIKPLSMVRFTNGFPITSSFFIRIIRDGIDLDPSRWEIRVAGDKVEGVLKNKEVAARACCNPFSVNVPKLTVSNTAIYVRISQD